MKFFKVDFGRFVEHHANYYSPEGELLEFGEQGLEPNSNNLIELPINSDGREISLAGIIYFAKTLFSMSYADMTYVCTSVLGYALATYKNPNIE